MRAGCIVLSMGAITWDMMLLLLLYVVAAVLLIVLGIFLVRLTGRWLDRFSEGRAAAVEAAFEAGFRSAVEQNWDRAYRLGAEKADRAWRDWYAVNYGEPPDGVAGSA